MRGAGTRLQRQAVLPPDAGGPTPGLSLSCRSAPVEIVLPEARALAIASKVSQGRPAGAGPAVKAPRTTHVPPLIVEEQVVKSRLRVKIYGEVFTQRQMVDTMLDLVHEELETGPDFVDKTFLEPAAGDGNFLVAILGRKLRAIEKRCGPESWLDESLFALASIYGIELLEDNHRDAKAAMFAEFLRFHSGHGVACGSSTRAGRAAAFLIDTNIVRGDTLKGLDSHGEEIQFSWWHRIADMPGMVQREPFTLASLRGDGMFDFTDYGTYAVSRIDQVHEKAKASG